MIVAAISLLLIWYIYGGYEWVLRVICHFRKSSLFGPEETRKGGELPFITVLVTVYNEVHCISRRIENLLNCDYPASKILVLIASDGSDDGTDETVASFPDSRVKLFVSGGRVGKTETQNRALDHAKGEIVVFTDAGSQFEASFLKVVANCFANTQVGAVDGHLIFLINEDNDIASSQGMYWQYELNLRALESRLGLLAISSGACLAVRKGLVRKMDPDIGEDCTVPLDVVEQGYQVVHASKAVVYDIMENGEEQELRARIRMTLRNWNGTWNYGALLNPVKNPGYAFALWSHKILRWLSPFILMTLFLNLNAWAMHGARVGVVGAIGMDLFVLAALVGWVGSRHGVSIPGAGVAFSFILANIGFLIGVIKAWSGHSIQAYKK